MANKENIQSDGVVLQNPGGGNFIVELDNGHTVICVLAGKIKMHYIRVIPGDKVKIEMSPYDLTRGRIVFRYK